MRFTAPKNTATYYWTKHIQMKMRQYGIGEGRIKRIVRAPHRTEYGIAPDTVAVMQPVSRRRRSDGTRVWTREYWVLYQVKGSRIRLISVWCYPGVTQEGEALPEELLQELRRVL